MPSMPDIRTIDFWLDGDQSERYSQSRLMQQHNKAGSHERRLAIYMNENFRIKEDLESSVFSSGFQSRLFSRSDSLLWSWLTPVTGMPS